MVVWELGATSVLRVSEADGPTLGVDRVDLREVELRTRSGRPHRRANVLHFERAGCYFGQHRREQKIVALTDERDL